MPPSIRETTSNNIRAIIEHDRYLNDVEREVLETACQILDHAGTLERRTIRTLRTLGDMQTPLMDPVFPVGRAGP